MERLRELSRPANWCAVWAGVPFLVCAALLRTDVWTPFGGDHLAKSLASWSLLALGVAISAAGVPGRQFRAIATGAAMSAIWTLWELLVAPCYLCGVSFHLSGHVAVVAVAVVAGVVIVARRVFS